MWAGRTARVVAGALVLVVAPIAAVSMMGCAETTPFAESTGRPSQDVGSSPPGAIAYVTAKAFARSVHPRAADTRGEIEAREFVFSTLQQSGYFPLLQEFISTRGGERVHSGNVIAVKEGESAERLIVGAHYDSVPGSDGYTDNAVGIGLLLEMAAKLKAQPTPYTIVFVAFGAKEDGLFGSHHFVAAMPKVERDATLGMVNLDGIAGGDDLYAYNRPHSAGWLRADVLAAAEVVGIPLRATPARPGTLPGTAALVSDDAAFASAGIPTAAVTATNWAAGERDGRTQTAKYGRVWHTPKDTGRFIEKNYPGRVQGQLSDLARLLEVLLTSELEKRP